MKLTTAPNRSENGSERQPRRGRRRTSRRRFSAQKRAGHGQGEERMGRGSARVREGLSNLKTEARGRRTWARRLRPGGSNRERYSGRRFGGGDEPDGWAPPVSREREREGAGWAAGFWAKMAERRKRERKAFSFLFSKQIFQTLFQMNF